MPHGTGKLQSWIKGLPPPGILFGDAGCDPSQDFIVQFHGQPHVVDESFWIFFSQLPHQCVILAELLPSGYPGVDPVGLSSISTGSQCPSVQIIIGKQKVFFFFFFFHFHESRPVATGGRGGAQPPLERFEPPLGCTVPFAVTIGIEVYPPLEFCQPPLLTIPGYGAA